MLPFGYDPKSYGGTVWWNENNPQMRAIWGTQEDYDKHVAQGGTWKEYEEKVAKRVEAVKQVIAESESKQSGTSMSK